MKQCQACKELLPTDEFNKNKAKKDGLQPRCRKCHNEDSRRYYSENKEYHLEYIGIKKRENIALLKQEVRKAKSVPCLDCGVEYPPYVMDFDHVRGDKLGNISSLIHNSISIQTLRDEIAKCDIVCSNCHRERSFSRREDWVLVELV